MSPSIQDPKDSSIKTREMHLHDLPWPTDLLAGLGNVQVTLRVTLSCIIESNPDDRGGIDEYAYQSHALALRCAGCWRPRPRSSD